MLHPRLLGNAHREIERADHARHADPDVTGPLLHEPVQGAFKPRDRMRPFDGIARMIDDNHGATGTGAARQFDQTETCFSIGMDPALNGEQQTEIEYEYASMAGPDRDRSRARLHPYFRCNIKVPDRIPSGSCSGAETQSRHRRSRATVSGDFRPNAQNVLRLGLNGSNLSKNGPEGPLLTAS
jgi:hypothetical protein